jgi:hypothetical protein
MASVTSTKLMWIIESGAPLAMDGLLIYGRTNWKGISVLDGEKRP